MGRSLQVLQGKTVVVKIGGEAFASGYAEGILKDVQFLSGKMNVVVVHGGGKEISEALKRWNPRYEPIFVNGLRRTGDDELEALKAVMPPIGAGIVRSIGRMGGSAKHVMGNAGLLRVDPVEELGYVGNVVGVNTWLLSDIISNRAVPVVTPLGFCGYGIYNINADMAASRIAVALGHMVPVRLVFVTNVDGVMDGPNLLQMIDGNRIDSMLQKGAINGGMEPKATAGLYAARNCVETVSLINGMKSRVLRLEVDGRSSTGTVIVA
jgi:acetylglutamate kinase